ncbi:MAG: TolC family protein [Planctomycetaceae bacterium]
MSRTCRPRTWLWITALAVLPALAGCRITKLRQADPQPVVPASFNGAATPDNSVQVGIREFFDDPVLVRYIAQGLAGNQQLKILAEDIRIADNEVLRRRGAYWPFLTFGGGAGLEKPSLFTPLGAVDANLPYLPGQFFPDPLPDFLFGANLSWQVDIWRQLRNARDAATLRYLGTADGRNYVVTRLVADIADNYYGLMARDQRLENLDKIIALQEQSLKFAEARKAAARGTELAVKRFEAEVRKNQSEKLIVRQEIIEVENRINYLLGRFPEPVGRASARFFEIMLRPLRVGLPSQLLRNRPDIRQAERELEAAGIDIRVARANFYPRLMISSGVGYEAFNMKYLVFTPESLIYSVAGNLVAPLINRTAIRADYQNANARQLQSIYRYQQVVINAFTEVINRINMVENYTRSIEIKQQQLAALEASVTSATNLFQNARVEYMDVLFAQRDLIDARMVLIDTKRQQLSAVVNAYQALGGGLLPLDYPDSPFVGPAAAATEVIQPGGDAMPAPAAEPEAVPAPEPRPLPPVDGAAAPAP